MERQGSHGILRLPTGNIDTESQLMMEMMMIAVVNLIDLWNLANELIQNKCGFGSTLSPLLCMRWIETFDRERVFFFSLRHSWARNRM